MCVGGGGVVLGILLGESTEQKHTNILLLGLHLMLSQGLEPVSTHTHGVRRTNSVRLSGGGGEKKDGTIRLSPEMFIELALSSLEMVDCTRLSEGWNGRLQPSLPQRLPQIAQQKHGKGH